MWFQFALLGALITGIGQVLVKKGQITFTPLLDNLVATIIVNTILVPLLLLYGINTSVGVNILAYAFIAAAMYSIFYYIISFGNVSLMISLINTFPLVTIALAVGFLHELPNPFQWLGIILVIIGFICISREKTGEKIASRKNWVLWGLFGSIAIGIAEFVTKLATLQVDGFTFTFFVYLMYILPLIVFMIFDKRGRKFKTLKNRSSLYYTCIGILCIEAGLIAIALAYQYGLASLVSPIVATHMLITAVLAAILLNERLLRIQKVGILLNLAGISIIGIYSGLR